MGYLMNLIEKINSRELKLAVIGLGYVGLPLAVELVATSMTEINNPAQYPHIPNSAVSISKNMRKNFIA